MWIQFYSLNTNFRDFHPILYHLTTKFSVPRNHDIQCTTKGISNRRHTKKYENDEMKSQWTSHLPPNHENRWHYSIYKGQEAFLTSVTRRVPLVEQELFSVPNGLFPLFRGVCVDQSLLFCVYVMSTIACPFLSVCPS